MNSAILFPGSEGADHAASERVEAESKPMLSDYPDLLTVQHLAEITGLAEQTIRRAMDKGQIPFVLIGGRRRYSPKTRFIEYVEGEGNAHS